MEIIYRASNGKEFKKNYECERYENNLKTTKNHDLAYYKDLAILFISESENIRLEDRSKKQDIIVFCKRAIDYLQKAIEIYDKNPDLYYLLGKAKFYSEEYQEAIFYYEKAIEMNYRSPSECYYWIGACKGFIREYQEAIFYYEKAIEIELELQLDDVTFACKAMIESLRSFLDSLERSAKKREEAWKKFEKRYENDSK